MSEFVQEAVAADPEATLPSIAQVRDFQRRTPTPVRRIAVEVSIARRRVAPACGDAP